MSRCQQRPESDACFDVDFRLCTLYPILVMRLPNLVVHISRHLSRVETWGWSQTRISFYGCIKSLIRSWSCAALTEGHKKFMIVL